MNIKDQDIFVTGGAGTIGKALARRRVKEGWTGKFTVYSTDVFKHHTMRKLFPNSKINYVCGDIRNYDTLINAMIGHDIVIHAAATKSVPDGEYFPINTIDVNVTGSQTVCIAAVQANIKYVVGISTDKACASVNLYGSTKFQMERIFQRYAEIYEDIGFHLVRYGNVLGSTGSFIHSWREQLEKGEPVWSTDPEMTRFWLTEDDAVDLVLNVLEIESGNILVPLLKSARIGDIEEWILGQSADEYIGLRPGEKIHETLMTFEEGQRCYLTGKEIPIYYVIYPSTIPVIKEIERDAFTSENAERLTKEEFLEMLGE